MKENRFLSIINNTLSDSSFLGDDCALTEEGLYVTQDSLLEGVHFDLKTITPFQLGCKAVAVNLSDLASCLAKPKYITVSFSAPTSCSDSFVEEFYNGIDSVCLKYGVKVIGGDITGGEKIYISVTAIGERTSRFLASRNCAKAGHILFTTGYHGLSAAGLCMISNEDFSEKTLIDAHLQPIPKIREAKMLADAIDSDIALMDTSDGLGDALYKISYESKVCLKADFSKLKTPAALNKIAKKYKKCAEDWIFWGGEDYNLVGTAPERVFNSLDKNLFTKIGTVVPFKDKNVIIENSETLRFIDKDIFEQKSYNHFS